MSHASQNAQSDFDRFRALTTRILTTPKAELVKASKKRDKSPKKRK